MEEAGAAVGRSQDRVDGPRALAGALGTSELRGPGRVFEGLYGLAVAMTADRSLGETLRLVVDEAREVLGTDTAYIALRDETRRDVYMHTASGVRTEAFRRMRVPFGTGLGGLVAETRRGYIVEDYFSDPKIRRVVDPIVACEGVVSGLAAPIQMGPRNLGVLYAFNRQRTVFRQEDLDVLSLIANLAAVVVSHAAASAALEEAHGELEERVRRRTAELEAANELLGREVEERRRAEVALRESERLRRQSERVARLGTYVLDLADDRWSGSDVVAELLGIDQGYPRTLEGWLGLVHPESREACRHALEEALRGSGRFDLEYPIVRPADAAERWLAVVGEVQRGEGGVPVRLIGTVQDVTSRRRAEEERAGLEDRLRQAQKMEAVGRLAGGVAHDFNNILTAILGYCDLLGRKLDLAASGAREVGEIRAAGERAAALTRQLLAFSRRQVLQPRVLDLAGVIDDVRKMIGRLLGEDIELEVLVQPGLGLVRADPGQIQQVILNLAVNARDAMPDGGRLVIEATNADGGAGPEAAEGRYVRLAVTDTGCGMDAATRARLFEPFFTTKETGKGTGLGLATVHGIVTQSGGHIGVESEAGRGTTFTVHLPRVEAAEVTEAAPPEAMSAPRGTETVLVAEDSGEVRALVRETLRSRGYRVLEAARGDEALRLGQEAAFPIDLLLTDVVMPGMNGRELAERLCGLRDGLKVLFMSGYTEDSILHHGVLAPGLSFIQKPFRLDELARKVREVLEPAPAAGAARAVS